MRSSILALMILLVISVSSPVFAASFDNSTVQYFVDVYNSRIDNAPGILKGLVGSERIDLNITRNDGSVYRTGFEMDNARISKTVEGGIGDPTISINATDDSINRIRNSDDPISTFKEERNYGGIDIEGHTLGTKIKLGVVLSSTDVLKFFSNMFFG